MAKTCSDVFAGALALNVANQAFASMLPAEVLAQLQRAQSQFFARLAQENRFFFATKQTLNSSNAAANRTLDLTGLPATFPLERLLHGGLLLPSGVSVNIVDFQDQGAELAPRAYPLGLILNEIGSEWGASGIVAFNLVYVYRPQDLDLTGALTQAIAVPDRFSNWLDYELATYFNSKDIGRPTADPGELQRLAALQETLWQDILQYADHVVGPMIRRFTLPVSAKGEKA